jgi:hypothetical protein
VEGRAKQRENSGKARKKSTAESREFRTAIFSAASSAAPKVLQIHDGFTGCGKSQFNAAFSSTGTLACAGFAACITEAQPRVAVLPNFFRNLFSR